ncbi:MAG TPA: M20/M25/M40 family metallo-hydrolase [Kofleriaceae bacterium]|jgi:hypothetical protein
MKRLLVLLLASCATTTPTAPEAKWVSDTATVTPAAPATGALATQYRDAAAKIIAAARADRGAYEKLEQLTDNIGHRLSGSHELDLAIAWAVQTMTADGHAVHTEKVLVPHWVRGAEDASIVAPIARPLAVLGLGGTIGTSKAGVTAPLVVVHTWDELAAKGDAVKGAIVLYDVPMPPFTPEKNDPHYGEIVGYRSAGASKAAKLGAVAVLMRSVTARSLYTLHAGAMDYAPDAPKIPAAAVTVEDAAWLARLAAKGPVSVHLHLEDQTLPDAESANVIGELRGREKPDEVIVIGGHIDSWDVGHGAHDDGAGIVTMMEALTVLRKLGMTPRRTIRVVLYTNEENGVRGGKGYAKDHEAELAKTVVGIESDTGGFSPVGFRVDAKDRVKDAVKARVADIGSLLAPLHANKVDFGHSGTDVGQMDVGGVVTLGLEVNMATYFDYHHTNADTLDKVDPQQLADDVAACAVMAYVIADMPDRIDAP